MREIERLRQRLKEEKEMNNKLSKRFRERKRQILKELEIMQERVKDLMYIGDLDERRIYYYKKKSTKE